MPTLNDKQTILLSAAAQRPGGNLLPPPGTLGPLSDGLRLSIQVLVTAGLAREVPVTANDRVLRSEGDDRFGVIITDRGLTAIGIEPDDEDVAGDGPELPAITLPDDTAEPRQTKTALVLELMRRAEGATLAELASATAWLPHTTRAALTGLRKKGHQLDKHSRNGQACYRIAEAG